MQFDLTHNTRATLREDQPYLVLHDTAQTWESVSYNQYNWLDDLVIIRRNKQVSNRESKEAGIALIAQSFQLNRKRRLFTAQ